MLIVPMNDVIVLVAVADEYVQVAVVSLESLVYLQVDHKQHPQYKVLNDCSDYLCSENPPKRLANAIPHQAYYPTCPPKQSKPKPNTCYK